MDVAARDVEAHVALLNEHQFNHDDSDATTCSSDDEFEYGLEPPVTDADRPIGDVDLERRCGDDAGQRNEATSDVDGEAPAAGDKDQDRHGDVAASETEDEYHFEKTVVSPASKHAEGAAKGPKRSY